MSDLISRCELFNKLATISVPAEANEFKAKIYEVIQEMETADRPQGEWLRDRYWSRGIGMGEEYGFFYKCSLCEYEVENGYTRCGFNFCPYCGAQMERSR